MKRLMAAAMCAGVMVAAIGSAQAAKKPVTTTMYLHGDAPVGEGLQGAMNISDGVVMKLDGNEPTEATPKSYNYNNPVGNDQCSGNSTFFPTWVGNIQGRIVGDATWTVHFVAPTSKVIARIWTDTGISSCNESYVPPAQEVVVDVPAGSNAVDIVFKKLNLKAQGLIMLELLQRAPAQQGRVLYDATDFASAITFKCIPVSGSSCI